MRTCTVCGKSSRDLSVTCSRCGSDLSKVSETARAKGQLVSNPRVLRIRVMASADACPACQDATGEFQKDDVTDLPVQGCSHPLGCRCFYEPALDTIYP